MEWETFEDEVRYRVGDVPKWAVDTALRVAKNAGFDSRAGGIATTVQVAGEISRSAGGRKRRRTTKGHGRRLDRYEERVLTPLSRQLSTRLARMITPVVEDARREVFGRADTPCRSLAEAWEWATSTRDKYPRVPRLIEVAATGSLLSTEGRRASTAWMELGEAVEGAVVVLQKYGIAERIDSVPRALRLPHPPRRLSIRRDELLADVPLRVRKKFARRMPPIIRWEGRYDPDDWGEIEAPAGSPLARLEEMVQQLSKDTLFPLQDLAAFALVGIPPELPAVTTSFRFSRSAGGYPVCALVLEVTTQDISSEELRAVYAEGARRLAGRSSRRAQPTFMRGRPLTHRVGQLSILVDERGGEPPRTQRERFWKDIAAEMAYRDWRSPMRAYRRWQRRFGHPGSAER